MLEHLITSKAKRKLLVVFLTSPANRFYVRELARKTGEQVNAVRQALSKLEKAGLVQSERQGNLLYYKADKECPIYGEMKGIVLKTEGAAGILKKEFEKRKGIRFSFIYGSVARGEEGAKSDIDVFIIGKERPEDLVRPIRKAEGRLGREINYVIYPEDEVLKRKGEGFVSGALRRGKIMLVGDEDELKRFVERGQDKEGES